MKFTPKPSCSLISGPAESMSDYLWSSKWCVMSGCDGASVTLVDVCLGKGRRNDKWMAWEETGTKAKCASAALKSSTYISCLGLCSNRSQVLVLPPPPPAHPTPQTCQATPLFGFHSNMGTDLDKSDSGVYFLHLEGRETQDWFYPLPGNSKASRRPNCQGKG